MDSVVEILGIVLALALVATPFVVGTWILRPLDRAAKIKRAPARFTLMDFIGLVFQFQIVTGIVRAMIPYEMEWNWNFWGICVFAWTAITAVWAKGVSTFSQAGIEDVWQRAILIFCVLPVAYVGSFAFSIIAGFLIGSKLEVWEFVVLTAIEIGLVASAIFSGIYTRRVVAPERSSAVA